jgi:DNA-binding NarL/FixJ family response regulator
MAFDALIVEDHPVVVDGLTNILRGHPGVGTIFVAYDGAQCMSAMQNMSPGLVLLDINLPDASGLDLCRNITEGWPGVKVIAVSSCSERSVIRKMMSLGASGYLLKNAPAVEIAEAIDTVMGGGKFFDRDVEEILSSASSAADRPVLTRREKEVLKYIADGLTNSEIAEKTFVSTLTIDTHRKNLLVKLGARNSAALVRIALERDLI